MSKLIGDSAAESSLRTALEDASIPTLLMVMVHLTGDDKWINEPFLAQRNSPDDGGFSPELQAEVREAAFVALSQYDADEKLDVPSRQMMIDMMNACVGEEVAPEYADLMFEELDFVSRDPEIKGDVSQFRVLVVGAGMSGLLAGIKLQAAGIPFTIIEKNADVGGTWLENTYPGAGVDTPNHFYSFSFEPNHKWSEYYSSQGEIRRYFEDVADRYELRNNIRFETKVERLDWDSSANVWNASIVAPGGTTETLQANSVITAVGMMNNPKMPPIPGIDSFEGPLFHSAKWDHDAELAGKRVGVIGTGASSMQFVPAIADTVGEMTIFQRSPQWTIPNPNYHRKVTDGKKWLIEHVPFYAKWYRFRLFWSYGDGLMPTLQKDPNWDKPELSINATNDRHRAYLTRYIDSQIGDDPELRKKVLPTYPPYGKRMLQDNNWYPTILRDNVELVTEAVDNLDATGVTTTDGTHREFDAIIFGTGFESFKLLWPMEIRGRSGKSMVETWGPENATAHLGITVPDFPNFFVMYGPNTNLGHGGSAIFQAECQIRHIMSVYSAMIDKDLPVLEVTREAHDDYVARTDERNEAMIWTHDGMDNWFRNSAGRVVTNCPWRLVDYWAMTHDADLDDYHTPVEAG